MLVKTYRDELSRTGLNIGEANARRYFSKRAPAIELRLDDLCIQCTLTPDFWQGQPRIQDPRLSEWLEFKVARRTAGRGPMPLSLTPFGHGSFIVRPVAESRHDAFGLEVSQARKEPLIDSAPPFEELSVA